MIHLNQDTAWTVKGALWQAHEESQRRADKADSLGFSDAAAAHQAAADQYFQLHEIILAKLRLAELEHRAATGDELTDAEDKLMQDLRQVARRG